MNKINDKHTTEEIKQTRNKRVLIPFKDSLIKKISIKNLDFELKEFKLDISKGSSLKGQLLRISRKTGKKDFTINI